MSLKNPVRYPVKYYSHLDVGAPQLANIDGNIKTIIKACLVTGIGAKVGAGWTSLFDDAFRIVLRRPLRTGNPPDIKIENGVINGAANHRIVSQDNPTGLDDANQLASVNLLARNSTFGNEWYLVASDFGFMLCYQMGDSGNSDKNHILYCGGVQKIQEADREIFITNSTTQIKQTGQSDFPAKTFFDANAFVKNMRTGVDSKTWAIREIPKPEKYFNNDYLAQEILSTDAFIMPFYTSVLKDSTNISVGVNPIKATEFVTIGGRPMLRYFNKLYDSRVWSPFYIPLDYWEL